MTKPNQHRNNRRIGILSMITFTLLLASTARPEIPTTTTSRPATPTPREPLTYTPTSLPPRLNITIDPAAMFTVLHKDVRGVWTTPDNRTWFHVRATPGNLDAQTARALIQREFNQPMPQLSLMRPILFEPTGRIWFAVQSNEAPLLAYDGKTFVEAPPEIVIRFRRTVYGGLIPSLQSVGDIAVYADGRAFFSAEGFVHVYDGHNWSEKQLSTPAPRNDRNVFTGPYTLALQLEPDGKGVIAASPFAAQHLWRWRDGQWTQYATGFLEPLPTNTYPRNNEGDMITSLALRHHGAWLFSSRQGLTFIPFDEVEAEKNQPLPITTFIGQLANEPSRENARRQLRRYGRVAEPDLRRALAASNDPQFKELLQNLLDDVKKPRLISSGSPMNSLSYQAWKLGDYIVSGVSQAIPLPGGSTAISADNISDAAGKPIETPKGPVVSSHFNRTLLIHEPNGNARILSADEIAYRLRSPKDYMQPRGEQRNAPLFVDSGAKIWTLGGREAPVLLDLPSGKILQRIPLEKAQAVLAATKDVLFVSTGLFDRERIIAYRPSAKDPRRTLQPATVTVGMPARSGLSSLTADGCFWFYQAPEGPDGDVIVARYDGKTITPYPNARIPKKDNRWIPQVILGSDGILLHRDDFAMLVSPRGAVSASSIEQLIEKHAAEVAKAFTGPRPIPRQSPSPTQIQADGNGNIWLSLQPSGQLKVFTEGQWLEASAPLKEAGSLTGKPALIIPVGKSPVILTSDQAPLAKRIQDAKVLFLLSIVDGKITAKSLPFTGQLPSTRDEACSSQGEPWIEVTRDPANPTRSISRRITSTGPVDSLENRRILAATPSGDLLLRSDTPQSEIQLYRDGKFFTLAVDPEMPPPSIGPGNRVTYPSTLGLTTFTITEKDGLLTCQNEEILTVPNANPRDLTISPRGFIVATPRPTPPGKPNLLFFSLAAP